MRYTLLPLLLLASPALSCTDQIPCEIGERSYHVREPDTWDGTSPLPVLLHFHGWGRQGTLTIQHNRIASGYVADNVLLLGPNGLGGSWDFWRPGLRDTPFGEAVLTDAATRYPIDWSRVYVSGYSWGSNMAWRFVCETEVPIRALVAVAGTLNQSETCASKPDHVAQTYGLDDQVLPYPFGPGGEDTHAVSLWRAALGCGEGTDQGQWNARPFLTFSRTHWDCADGTVTLDTHPGGHFIPHDWIALQVARIEHLP